MKLKNLFTCTVTGLLLCTSCIKDEAPNAEADILSCILLPEMLTGTDIDYNRPYDKSLNATLLHRSKQRHRLDPTSPHFRAD